MKAKLSFLALPLCVGLVLTFVLAACDSGGGSPGGERSSSSVVVYNPSSAVQDSTLELLNFGGIKVSDRYVIQGRFNTKGTDIRIVMLEFITAKSGWVFYENNKVTGPIKNISLKNINLANVAYIDLTNPDIPCGEHAFSVKACVDAAGKNCTSDNGKFEKSAAEYCASSEGGASSSSEAKWVFDSEQTKEVKISVESTISSAVKFKIIEYEYQGSTVNAVNVTSGNIRSLDGVGTGSLFDMDSDNNDGYPKPNKEYKDSKFSGMGAPMNGLDIQKEDYYFLYSDSGSEKYLIMFEPVSDNWDTWRARYWKVKTSP